MKAAGGRFDDATLATLEFADVKEQIAAHSTCVPGAAALRSLQPDRDRSEARADLALVEDAVGFFDAGGDFGFAGVVDVTASLERASVGGVLSGSDLRDIARSERALSQAALGIKSSENVVGRAQLGDDVVRRAQLGGDVVGRAQLGDDVVRRAQLGDDVVRRAQLGGGAVDLGGGRPLRSTVYRPPRPLLALSSQRRPTDPLIRRLETSIEPDGTVADAASSELARVRRQQRSLTEEIRRRVDDIIKKPNTAKLLSEEIVTVRGGRYVVPVRTEFAAQFPGVVHAQSASGATVFIEPMACVEANNRLRGLEAAEEREINRVLAELTALVGKEAEAVSANSSLLAILDSVGARARWALRKGALCPLLVETQSVRIVHGRHPLLRREAVPLDVSVGIDAQAVIISGPNMGGKTVVLKTIGLFCLLAYAGIPLPSGPETEIGSFDHIACVVGDDQSIANDLSSFSAHLRALHGALERAGPRSIVLVDEIGNGTEPGAGAALAQAFIEALLALGARVVVTTHFTQLKIFAASREHVANASMLFDAATHEPTYVLAMGVPGQSLAFALARTIGLDARAITRAEELLGSDAQNLERAFEGLATEREHLRSQALEVDRELQRLRTVESELRDRIAAAQADRAVFEKEAAAALDRAVRAVREELLAKAERSEQDSRRQRARPVEDADDAMRKTMTDIRRSLGLDRSSDAEPAPNAYAVGDRVYVRSFGQPGVVSEVYDRDVLVTIGNVKAVVARRDLTRDPVATKESGGKPARGAAHGEGGPQRLASLDASTSIDVRGMRVDEAMQVVDKALDDASLAGLAILRIIHGKGTGQLGRGIRDSLKGHAQVAGLESAPDREGGTGVTVVTLR